MADDYVIVEHDTGDGRSILVLSKTGRRDFLSEMRGTGGDKKRYRLIVRVASRIEQSGTGPFMGTSVRSLDNDLSLVEIKVPAHVIRVMAYKWKRMVLLFDFDGHQGKSGKISPSDMKRGKRLAKIARDTVMKSRGE